MMKSLRSKTKSFGKNDTKKEYDSKEKDSNVSNESNVSAKPPRSPVYYEVNIYMIVRTLLTPTCL